MEKVEKELNILSPEGELLSPFSLHSIVFDEEIYSTVEHAYQALRIISGIQRDVIKNATTPLEAWNLGQKYKKEYKNIYFDKDKVMRELSHAKIEQHAEVKEFLKNTGDRKIVKNIKEDSYWGTGVDGKGLNKMGKIWEEIREKIKNK